MDMKSRMKFKNLEESQVNEDYIGDWFQKVTRPQHSSILQQSLAFNRNVQLISHILENIELYTSNFDASILEILIYEWLHWKYYYI